SPMKSQSRFVQTMRSSRGLSSSGRSVNDSGLNRVRHHGHSSSGIGEGLPLGSFLNWRTLARAESDRLSPFFPRTFGVAAFPTQSPISNGHTPYRFGASSLSNSRAHTSPAARDSWSSVSKRSV